MSDTSKHRLATNEALFRAYNERVQREIEAVKAVAKEDNQEDMLSALDIPIRFYCECSDEHCRKRISLKPSRYAEIHKARNHFIIIPGHETNHIESVISKKPDFYIVEKFVPAPELA